MSRRFALILRWTIGGSLVGLAFPIAAWLVAGGISAPAIAAGHASQPVLWIVDLAPVVLAGAGALIGLQHARVDASLRITDRRVNHRTSELKAANQRLKDLMASKDRFVAMVSHEVRTPLTGVMGFAQELRDGLARFSDQEVAELSGLIADQSMEISNIIEDMLVAARADMGSLTVVPEEIDLREQAEMVISACGCAASVRQSIELESAHAKAWADPGRVRQIVRNLITNAARYGGDKTVLQVASASDRVCISVRDNGGGVPEQERQRIFEPYQQSDSTPKVAGSVGLGLHVSRLLARAMGGDLTYRYENGHSIFDLTVPAVVTADQEKPLSKLSVR